MTQTETSNMKNVKYGCFSPKIDVNTGEIYHKELIIFAIQDWKIIGAELFDFKGYSIPIDHTDLTFQRNTTYEENQIYDGATSLLEMKVLSNSTLRSTFLFKTKAEAYIQKLTFLKNIRTIFFDNEKKRRSEINKKIPANIAETIEKNFEDHPEILL